MNDIEKAIETLKDMKGVFDTRGHKQYSLSALDLAISALEKQIASKQSYCSQCGQKIDWSVEMGDKEQQFILKTLNRFIKKMCVTKDRNELQSSTVWAIRYAMMLNDMRDAEMYSKQVYGEEVEEE